MITEDKSILIGEEFVVAVEGEAERFIIRNNEKYEEISRKIDKIYNKYPRVMRLLEFNKATELKGHEVKALLECIDLYRQQHKLIFQKMPYIAYKYANELFYGSGLINFDLKEEEY